MIDPNEFDDLMPHQIAVQASGGTDDYGKPTAQGPIREYKCLITQAERIERTTEGTSTSAGEAAFCNPIPIGESVAVDILDDDFVTITKPVGKDTRPVSVIERHYDETGDLYALTVRFS
jgi:hypothetical protein